VHEFSHAIMSGGVREVDHLDVPTKLAVIEKNHPLTANSCEV
jgi:hypothetical protein